MASPLRGRRKCWWDWCWAANAVSRNILSSGFFKCHPTDGRKLAFLPWEFSNPIKRPLLWPHSSSSEADLPFDSDAHHCAKTWQLWLQLWGAQRPALAPRLSPSSGALWVLANYGQWALSAGKGGFLPQTQTRCLLSFSTLSKLGSKGICVESWTRDARIILNQMLGLPLSLENGLVFKEKINERFNSWQHAHLRTLIRTKGQRWAGVTLTCPVCICAGFASN